ncbi:MAG: NAD(P)H-dependent oxidoreductase subunit E [Chloroflexia bacterium]
MSKTPISEIIDRYPAERTSILAILEDIQAEYKYLPREALEMVADRLRVKLSEVYQLATFYKAFSLTPKGDFIIKVCLGTACHVGGGPRVLAAMEKALGIRAGETSPDNKFSLEAIRCVGACALGPMVLVNDRPYSKMTPMKAEELVGQLQRGEVAVTPAAVTIEARPSGPVDLSTVPPAG